MKTLNELVKRLEKLAKRNNLEFDYSIAIKAVKGRVGRYEFDATENMLGKNFLTGGGPTLEDAVSGATAGIPDACKSWGYKE